MNFHAARANVVDTMGKATREAKDLEGCRTVYSSCIVDMLQIISRQLDVLIEKGNEE